MNTKNSLHLLSPPAATRQNGTRWKRRLLLAAVGFMMLPCHAQDLSWLLESDCCPRGSAGESPGDGLVTFLDWATVAMLAAGLYAPPTWYDFSVADCAPRATLGDGAITAADVIQSYRDALRLDAWRSAGGPTNAVWPRAVPFLPPERIVSVTGTDMVRGQTNVITVTAAGIGDEAAFGFTMRFDPSELQFKGIPGYTDSFFSENLLLNTNQIGAGILGVLCFGGFNNPGPPVMGGDLMKVMFVPSPSASSSTAIDFIDSPVVREVANTNADPLLASFKSGTVRIFDCRLSDLRPVAGGLQLTLLGMPGAYAVQKSNDLVTWQVIDVVTNTAASLTFIEPLTALPGARFYRARHL